MFVYIYVYIYIHKCKYIKCTQIVYEVYQTFNIYLKLEESRLIPKVK